MIAIVSLTNTQIIVIVALTLPTLATITGGAEVLIHATTEVVNPNAHVIPLAAVLP